MKLRVRGKVVAVNRIEPNLGNAQLTVPTRINCLLESNRLADWKLHRRERKPERERRLFAVAKIRAKLESRAKCPAVCLREEWE